MCGVALCVRDVRHTAHAKQDNERQEALLAAEEQKLIQMEEELKEAKVKGVETAGKEVECPRLAEHAPRVVLLRLGRLRF